MKEWINITTNNKIRCISCKHLRKESEYYKLRQPNTTYPNGYLNVCKVCLGNSFQSAHPSTFMNVLQALEIPWLPIIYKPIVEDYASKGQPNSTAILGNYISKMKLNQYSKYNFKTSDSLQQLYETDETFDPIDNYKHTYSLPLGTPIAAGHIEGSNFHIDMPVVTASDELYAMEDKEVMLGTLQPGPGVLNIQLTPEEYRYLILKWGESYPTKDLIALERTYVEVESDFDITTAMDRNYLKILCQTSVAMSNAMEAQDSETFSKLSAAYSRITKEAQLQPSQTTKAATDVIDSVGQIVRLAEQEGPIARYDIETDPDEVDIAIKDIKLFNKRLVQEDDTIAQRYDEAALELIKQDNILANGMVYDSDYDDEEIEEPSDVTGAEPRKRKKPTTFERVAPSLDLDVYDELK